MGIGSSTPPSKRTTAAGSTVLKDHRETRSCILSPKGSPISSDFIRSRCVEHSMLSAHNRSLKGHLGRGHTTSWNATRINRNRREMVSCASQLHFSRPNLAGRRPTKCSIVHCFIALPGNKTGPKPAAEPRARGATGDALNLEHDSGRLAAS
jgi:hypothetical protein